MSVARLERASARASRRGACRAQPGQAIVGRSLFHESSLDDDKGFFINRRIQNLDAVIHSSPPDHSANIVRLRDYSASIVRLRDYSTSIRPRPDHSVSIVRLRDHSARSYRVGITGQHDAVLPASDFPGCAWQVSTTCSAEADQVGLRPLLLVGSVCWPLLLVAAGWQTRRAGGHSTPVKGMTSAQRHTPFASWSLFAETGPGVVRFPIARTGLIRMPFSRLLSLPQMEDWQGFLRPTARAPIDILRRQSHVHRIMRFRLTLQLWLIGRVMANAIHRSHPRCAIASRQGPLGQSIEPS